MAREGHRGCNVVGAASVGRDAPTCSEAIPTSTPCLRMFRTVKWDIPRLCGRPPSEGLAKLKSLRHCQNDENGLEKALIFSHPLTLQNPKLRSSPTFNPDPPLTKATQSWVSR